MVTGDLSIRQRPAFVQLQLSLTQIDFRRGYPNNIRPSLFRYSRILPTPFGVRVHR